MTIKVGNLYYEFRKDGWPLCPWCGEEELWCLGSVEFQKDNQRPPSVAECIEMGLSCYRCTWASSQALYTIVSNNLVAVQIDMQTSLTVTSLAYFMTRMPKKFRNGKALRWASSEVDQKGQRWGIIRILNQASPVGTGLYE